MIVCANQNKMFVGKVGNAMSNYVPARRLNLLSLWGAHWVGEKTNE